MEHIKRAIIIAAGEGTRLRPVTEQTPKPLVRVKGTRLIDNTLRALKNNGIHEIYIVAGYKKEQFHEEYADDPDIHVIDNPYYAQGNNITSVYMAREHLPQSFVIEGDLVVMDETIFNSEVEISAYCGTFMHDTPEWALKTENGKVISCDIAGGTDAYRNLGISMWTQKDGEILSQLIKEQFEDKKDWSIYWDEVPLDIAIDRFDIGVRDVKKGAIAEIDTVAELAAIDPSYEHYLK